MKISLFVVGKTNHNYLSPGIDDYTKRINHYIPFNIQYIADAKNTKNLSQAQQKQAEGQNLLNAFDKSDYVVLLDERGKEFTSKDFSSFIEKKMQTVAKDIYQRANEKISLSKMTFPHDLIRLIFTEQLYRSFTIMNNEPYHHD